MKKKPTSHETKPKARATASGISVHCLHDEIVSAESLQPFEGGNYRKHSAAQLDKYERIIERNGWRRAVVVWNGHIVKGHGAWLTAKRRGWDVPIERQNYASRAEAIRDLVADNRLSALAEDDDDALKKLLGELDAGEIELTGISATEFEELLAETISDDAQFPITAKLHESYDYVVIATDNTPDFIFLQTLCGVQPERSYKKTGVGLGRVVLFKRFIQSLRENHHSINVPSGHNDNTPADSGRADMRTAKPAKGLRKAAGKRPAKDRK